VGVFPPPATTRPGQPASTLRLAASHNPRWEDIPLRILNVRPAAGPKTLAYFDVEIGDHLRIYNLQLRDTPVGLRTVAPNACGKHAATFHPALAAKISEAAAVTLGGQQPHDLTH
jgi:hypothetical protein